MNDPLTAHMLRQQERGDPPRMEPGTVTATAPAVRIRLDSETTGMPIVPKAGYAPTIGDRALLLVDSAYRVVLQAL